MSDLQVYQHRNFGLVRVLYRENEPWFLAADICCTLGLSNTTEALRNLDPDEKSADSVMAGTRMQKVNFVSESGMYALIMRSNKPDAKAFRKWITSVVIPSIRKNGSFSLESCSNDEIVSRIIGNPDGAIKMLTAYKEEKEKREEAERQRDAAIRDKRKISEKREAVCLNRLAQKTRECNRLQKENRELKIRLGEDVDDEYIEMKNIKWINEIFLNNGSSRRAIAFRLKRFSRKMNAQIKSKNNKVCLYSSKVIDAFHKDVLAGNQDFFLNKYKK